MRGGICGMETKATPLSPKSARQSAFQVASSVGSFPSRMARMLWAAAVTMVSIM
ncbi:hypothetical protein D3C71_2216250 [compost metagenome]